MWVQKGGDIWRRVRVMVGCVLRAREYARPCLAWEGRAGGRWGRWREESWQVRMGRRGGWGTISRMILWWYLSLYSLCVQQKCSTGRI